MSLIHDTIKIKYAEEGYLPDYPYHLVSDEEMCEAFILNESNYFDDNYPLIAKDLETEYNALKDAILHHIHSFISSKDDNKALPDWVYSYMLGAVISVNSDEKDRHDLLVFLDSDNIDDIITEKAQRACFQESKEWLRKLSREQASLRPPALFGEPHVVKSLRIKFQNN